MSKPIHTIPRLNWTRALARSVLVANKVDSFPIDVRALIKTIDGTCIKKYSTRASRENITIQQYSAAYGTEEGFTLYSPHSNRYTVVYNDTCKSIGRVRWTLAHELGHMVLNHHKDFDQTRLTRNGLTNDEYQVLDKEADAFAAELLAPTILAAISGWTSITDLMRHNGLSKQAASNRSKSLNNIIPAIKCYFTYEEKLMQQFYKHIYINYCPECKTFFVSKQAKYCPICGSHNIMWKEGKENVMKYPGIEVDKNSKAIVCPRCQNEEIEHDGNYCKICGEHLINFCEGYVNEFGYATEQGCQHILPGNARFCPYCGKPSHFFNAGFLISYKDMQAQQSNWSNTQPFDINNPPF